MSKLGSYAFIAGIVISILIGLLGLKGDTLGTATAILVILGLIVGLLNVTAGETVAFLVATIALIVAGTADLAVIPMVGNALQFVLAAIVVFVAPAAIVVALKAIYALASSR